MHFETPAKQQIDDDIMINLVNRFEIWNIFQARASSNKMLEAYQFYHVWWFSFYESIPFWNLLRCQYRVGLLKLFSWKFQTSSNNSVSQAMISFFFFTLMLSSVLGQGTSPGEFYPVKCNRNVSCLRRVRVQIQRKGEACKAEHANPPCHWC